MLLFRNPVTNEGDIRYFEVFKIFLFVLFLFGLFSRQITQVKGFDILSAYMLTGLTVMYYFSFIYHSYKEFKVAFKHLLTVIKKSIKTFLQQPVIEFQYNAVTYSLLSKNTNTQKEASVYCVFRC